MNAISLDLSELLGGPRQRREPKQPTPATREQVLAFLEGANQAFAVGDIVTWRNQESMTHTAPGLDEKVIVTRVLPAPHKADRDGVPESIAIAFQHQCDEEDCKNEGQVFEVLMDGRRFKKVGSIVD